MFQLRYGYFISGILTGLVVLVQFLGTLTDRNIKIVHCSVGQGDASYVRFPDGRDMVIDGGPNDAVISCLSKYMPFWDRHIDIVLLTHPQKDHMQGLLTVLDRYDVGYLVLSDVVNNTEGYEKLVSIVDRKKIPVKFVTLGDRITVSNVTMTILWPSAEQIVRMKPSVASGAGFSQQVLGTSSTDLNDGSIVFWLRYGTFDEVFTGDADTRVEKEYLGTPLSTDGIEVLKVPHHGSKTGMSASYLLWLKPKLGIISVGKNSYGHPADSILKLLEQAGASIKRTDQAGDVQIVSDRKVWRVR